MGLVQGLGSISIWPSSSLTSREAQRFAVSSLNVRYAVGPQLKRSSHCNSVELLSPYGMA